MNLHELETRLDHADNTRPPTNAERHADRAFLCTLFALIVIEAVVCAVVVVFTRSLCQ